jgi:hypothetical protein
MVGSGMSARRLLCHQDVAGPCECHLLYWADLETSVCSPANSLGCHGLTYQYSTLLADAIQAAKLAQASSPSS